LAAVWALGDAPRLGVADAVPEEPATDRPDAPAALDIEQVRTLGQSMMKALERGSFDDKALAELTAALRGCVAGDKLEALQRTLDDFDFAAARNALQELLDECLVMQRTST
jgi:hypothetical protein